MDFKVLITDNAISDLKEIVEFVAQDNPVAAARLGERLANHALSLNTLPARFPLYDKQRNIRKMAVPPYLIFTNVMRKHFRCISSTSGMEPEITRRFN